MHDHRRIACALIAALIAWSAVAFSLRAAEPAPVMREIRNKDGAVESQWQVKRGEDGREHRHGRFMRFHDNGKPALEAWYRDDQATGIWTWWDRDGNLLRSVEYEYGVPVPLRGDSLQEPTYAFTQLNGRKTAEGLLKGEKPHGKWVFWHPDGNPKAEGEYLTGIPHGRWVYYFPGGQIERETRFVMGILHGELREAYPNGQERRRGRMDQGLKAGHWRYWYEDGRLRSEGDYLNDRLEGEWRFWNKEGALFRRILYRNGEPVEELDIPDDERSRATARITTETDIRAMPMLFDEHGEPILPRER